MRNNSSTILVLLFRLITLVCYIINFIQLMYAILEGNITLIIIKAIGVIIASGSIITVWF